MISLMGNNTCILLGYPKYYFNQKTFSLYDLWPSSVHLCICWKTHNPDVSWQWFLYSMKIMFVSCLFSRLSFIFMRISLILWHLSFILFHMTLWWTLLKDLIMLYWLHFCILFSCILLFHPLWFPKNSIELLSPVYCIYLCALITLFFLK